MLSSQLLGLREDEIPDDLFRDNPITLNFSFTEVCPYTGYINKAVNISNCIIQNLVLKCAVYVSDLSDAEFSHD